MSNIVESHREAVEHAAARFFPVSWSISFLVTAIGVSLDSSGPSCLLILLSFDDETVETYHCILAATLPP